MLKRAECCHLRLNSLDRLRLLAARRRAPREERDGSLDGVADAAVFGLPDERLGDIVAAAVVGDADVEALGTALRSTLSGYKVPEHWLRVDTLPRNANGKVDRAALRAMAGN